jgi:hypothetical protein
MAPSNRFDATCDLVGPVEASVSSEPEAVRRAFEVPRRRGELILATSKVEDFDRWMKILSTKSVETRKQHGSKGSTVFRDPDEDGRVWVLSDWDEEDWKTSSPTPISRRCFKKPGSQAGPRWRSSPASTTPNPRTWIGPSKPPES